jgi:hypothetical protein
MHWCVHHRMSTTQCVLQTIWNLSLLIFNTTRRACDRLIFQNTQTEWLRRVACRMICMSHYSTPTPLGCHNYMKYQVSDACHNPQMHWCVHHRMSTTQCVWHTIRNLSLLIFNTTRKACDRLISQSTQTEWIHQVAYRMIYMGHYSTPTPLGCHNYIKYQVRTNRCMSQPSNALISGS